MKRTLLILASLVALVSCKGPSDVPFTELDHYFFKNGQAIPDNPKIDSEEAFNALFGMAAVMGTDGQLVFTYAETVGDKQTWTMQPVLLVKVDRRFEAGTVRLEKKTR